MSSTALDRTPGTGLWPGAWVSERLPAELTGTPGAPAMVGLALRHPGDKS